MLVCGSGCSVDGPTESLGEDPGLDQELSKPFKEALVFLQRVDNSHCTSQNKSLSTGKKQGHSHEHAT
uniref:Uncharacterized protein n=1 Tax=Brassica oleracea var. oleracea TaxID=109376 RepID=A0A0D3BVQ0_BRAOL